MSGCFHVVSFQGSSMLNCVSVLHFFLLPNNILLYAYATVYLFKKWRSRRIKRRTPGDFPGGPVVKNLPCNVGNTGSIPGCGALVTKWCFSH